MPEISLFLIASAFIAGLLMFLAPCTLPLVPAYLAFIAGIKPGDQISEKTNRRIVVNSLYYIAGFSVVFVSLGFLAGWAGAFVGSLRQVLIPLSGVLVIIFGLQMLHIINISKLFGNFKITLPSQLTPGSPTSAFVIGVAFALGWTPCVGPLLATILLMAGTSGSVFGGVFLLSVFAAGLALPFFITAVLYASATKFISTHQGFIKATEFVGGGLLLLIGVLLLTNNFELTVLYGYKILEFFGIGNLLDYY